MSVLRPLVPGMVLLLSACGGGGGDNGSGSGGDSLLQGCRTISGGRTQVSSTVSPTCSSCAASEPTKGIDDDGRSYATLFMPANASGTVTLRATAQPGIVFPNGSLAGMTHSISYGVSVNLDIKLYTYLGGTLQETFSFNNGTVTSGGNNNPGKPGRVSYTTTKQYDAVELSVTRTGGSGEVTARLHEFCSN